MGNDNRAGGVAKARRASKRQGATEDGERISQATVLVELCRDAKLWHTADGDAFATIRVAGRGNHDSRGHVEHHRLRSKAFRVWLARRFYLRHKAAPGSQAIADALNVLEGRAVHAGPQHDTFVRVAEHDERIYLDLCDPTWRAVEIDAQGWRVVANPPVRFRRAKAMLALPEPARGGSISELRGFVNVLAEGWALLIAWLVAALRPSGPYPVLELSGEQGNAKSTTAKVLRALGDPNSAPIRAEPRDARDLMIAASNGRFVALDNLSHLPAWLSDALCRLSTGGGFSTRMLYENDEEIIFDAMRPIILTGIEDVATRGDLLDRSIPLHLPQIPDHERRSEAEFWREFEERRPFLLGALLDAVSTGLRNLPQITLPALPRMADFAKWAVACEPAMGCEAGAFLDVYASNRAQSHELAIESSTIGALILDASPFVGTASELLEALELKAEERLKRSRGWPKSARALSGMLRRLAPNLRATGVEVTMDGREPGGQRRRLIEIRTSTQKTDPTVPQRPVKRLFGTDGDANGTQTGPPEPPKSLLRDDRDGRDAKMPSCSNGDDSSINRLLAEAADGADLTRSDRRS